MDNALWDLRGKAWAEPRPPPKTTGNAFMGWDSVYAADMVRGLEAVDPFWLEEPLPPERLASFRRLAASSRVRLATGEHAHTRWQIKEILDSGAIGVIQADPDWAGGISEQRHICSLCAAYDVPVVAHGHTVPAALHVAASQSPQTVPMVEYLVRVQEWTQHFQKTVYRPAETACRCRPIQASASTSTRRRSPIGENSTVGVEDPGMGHGNCSGTDAIRRPPDSGSTS